jgi:IS5 family transposase
MNEVLRLKYWLAGLTSGWDYQSAFARFSQSCNKSLVLRLSHWRKRLAVVQGRRMRVDTTVVETNIHYPTDSGLMGDGVRVLTRLMKKVTEIAGVAGTKLRDRKRSMQRRLVEIGRATRSKGKAAQEKVQAIYRKLVEVTSRVVGQAKKFSAEIGQGTKQAADVLQQATLEGLRRGLERSLPLCNR